MPLRTFVLYFLILLGGAESITESWGASQPVFALPKTDAAEIGFYDSAVPPEIISRRGEWIQIIVPKGSLVWVFGRFVDADTGQGRVTSSAVRMRPLPRTGVGSEPLGVFGKGDEVDVVETKGDWKRVQVSLPVVGWIKPQPTSAMQSASTETSSFGSTATPVPPANEQVTAAGLGIATTSVPERVRPNVRASNTDMGVDVAAPESMPPTPAGDMVSANSPGLNKKIAADSSPVAADADLLRYVVGVSDALSIEIRNLGEIEYSLKFRVPSSGVISVPLLGEIAIAGSSPAEIERYIERRLSNGYLNGPEVSVSVYEYRPFYINGEVKAPGAFPFQHNLSVQKAITLAGGFTKYADDSNILVAREGEVGAQAQRLPLTARIKAGDVITIGKGASREDSEVKFVYLYGEVKKPGSYEYRSGMTVEKAVALAGGFGDRASKKKISIRRSGDGSPEVIKRVDLFAEVEPGDVLTVGQSIF